MDRVTRHLVFQLPQTSHRADSDDDVFGSAQHSSQRVVRSGSLYDLRAYRGERKPSKLYDEDEQEQYRLSSINTSLGSQGDSRHKGSFTSSFALSFDKSSGRAATPVDPENIDTEQINFSAARQQFLMLEKTNPGSFVSPGQQAMSPRPESVTRVSRQEWSSPEMTTKAAKGYGNAGASSQSRTDKTIYQVYSVSYKTPVKEEVYAPKRMYNEGNAGYTSDGSTSNEEMKISNETPIEREIRMAMEREENLWKERGIPRLTSSSELVEIQTKPLLSMLTSPGPGRKGKDRGRASLYLQREIEQETKREEALKKQGRLLGTYDRGTQQELDERRRVFEQEEAPPQKPIPTRNADEQRIWIREFVVQQPPSHSPHHTEDTRGGRSLPSSTLSTTHFQGSQPRFTASEKSQDQPLVSQHVSASTSKWGSKDSWGGRLPGSTPSPPGTTVLPREYFSFSFWKPKVSFVDEMGTQSPLRREDSRDEQYKLRTWKPQTSAMIEEEIRSDLQREEELQEQRRQRQLIDGYSVVSSDGFPQEDSRSRHSSGKGELGQGTGTSLLPSRVSAGTIRGAGVSPRGTRPTGPSPRHRRPLWPVSAARGDLGKSKDGHSRDRGDRVRS
uniref:A-kinase anchor protein 2 C-terminal domain-containing protein n=1 Tax=Calidris pygmaea TaxID=425635 RepID=A0A8C3K568_9CHAR